jgi:DNA replication initiation complex subunit (GINS family)
METLKIQTINTISSKINFLLTRVQNSTGSLHTKDDVRTLLTNLENELYDELGQVFDNAPVVENFTDQRFTMEEVMSVLENVSYSDYMKADVDSAEFSMSYRNQVELDSCDVDFDYDDFYTEVQGGLEELLEEKQKQAQPTEVETITIID